MSRRQIYLGKTTDVLSKVRKRNFKNPTISIVNAEEAFQKGIKFYDMNLVS